MGTYKTSPTAMFLLRLWASLLDGALAAVAIPVAATLSHRLAENVILYFASEALTGEGLTQELVLGCLVALGIVVCFSLLAWYLGSALVLATCEALFGATPGKYLLGLRVISFDGAKPGIFRAVLRQSAKLAAKATLGIGYLMSIWTATGQALHDKLARCRVIRLEHRGVGHIILAIFLSCALLSANYSSLERTYKRIAGQIHAIRQAYILLAPAAQAAWEILNQELEELERSRSEREEQNRVPKW